MFLPAGQICRLSVYRMLIPFLRGKYELLRLCAAGGALYILLWKPTTQIDVFIYRAGEKRVRLKSHAEKGVQLLFLHAGDILAVYIYCARVHRIKTL